MPASPPALDELMLHINHSHLRRYTAKRDEYRAMVDDPPRWADINPTLAYAVCPYRPKTSSQILQASLRAWRKSYKYGNNRGKGLSGAARETAESCPHCHVPETPSHIYAECDAPGIQRIRARLKADQQRLLATLTHGSIPEWQRLFCENLYVNAFSPDDDFPEKIWNATLGQADLLYCFDQPTDAAHDMTAKDFQSFRKLFIKFVTPFTAAAIEMEQVKFKLKFGSIVSSLGSALHRRSLRPVPEENSPIDPAHPIIATLNVTIQPRTRTPRQHLHDDTPPPHSKDRHQSVLSEGVITAGPTPRLTLLSPDDRLHLLRHGTDPCDLPCHRASTEAPSSLDDLSLDIDPEPPPD